MRNFSWREVHFSFTTIFNGVTEADGGGGAKSSLMQISEEVNMKVENTAKILEQNILAF